MEPAREPPWAEHEKVCAAVAWRPRPIAPNRELMMMVSWKVYLLAEIIKSSLPSHVLFNIIRDSQIQPKWNDIALPQGTCAPDHSPPATAATLYRSL